MYDCRVCGESNSAGSQLCSRCGAPASGQPVASSSPLPALTPAVSDAPPAAAQQPVVGSSPLPALTPAISDAPLATAQQPAASSPAPVSVSVSVATVAPTVVVMQQASGPGCLVRGLWFICIGLWLGALTTFIAWPLIISIVGMPIGLMLLNRLPKIMTLQPASAGLQVIVQDGVVIVGQGRAAQHPLWLRALYFVFVGSWLSALWLTAAWAIAGFTFGLGLPLAFWMFNRVPAVTTLGR